MTVETFGAMLKRHRVGAGLSQNQLARQAGVDPAYVQRFEAGTARKRKDGQANTVSRAIVLAFAEVLNVSQAEADRMLFSAGLAPQEDWQTRAEAAEAKLDIIRQAFDLPSEVLTFRRRVG